MVKASKTALTSENTRGKRKGKIEDQDGTTATDRTTDLADAHEAQNDGTGTDTNAKKRSNIKAQKDAKQGSKTKKQPVRSYGMRSNQKYDWIGLREQFVEGIGSGDDRHFPGLKELADMHEVPYQRMRERSSKERWADRRMAFQIDLTKERQKKHVASLAKNAVVFDEKAYKVADLGMMMVTARLAEIAQEVTQRQATRADALRRQAEGLPVERHELYSAVNYKEMEGLANAAGTFQSIGMKALGTDVNRHEISGPDGGPIETQTISIVAELGRDDPERFTHLVRALIESNLIPEEMVANGGEVVIGELVDDGNDQTAIG